MDYKQFIKTLGLLVLLINAPVCMADYYETDEEQVQAMQNLKNAIESEDFIQMGEILEQGFVSLDNWQVGSAGYELCKHAIKNDKVKALAWLLSCDTAEIQEQALRIIASCTQKAELYRGQSLIELSLGLHDACLDVLLDILLEAQNNALASQVEDPFSSNILSQIKQFVNHRDRQGFTPLMEAALNEYRNLEKLLKLGADVQAVHEQTGQTALHYLLTWHTNPELVHMLCCEYGANPNAMNLLNPPQSPLMMAEEKFESVPDHLMFAWEESIKKNEQIIAIFKGNCSENDLSRSTPTPSKTVQNFAGRPSQDKPKRFLHTVGSDIVILGGLSSHTKAEPILTDDYRGVKSEHGD